MLKRKAFWLLLLSAGGIMRLGLECWPEPDIGANLLQPIQQWVQGLTT